MTTSKPRRTAVSSRRLRVRGLARPAQMAFAAMTGVLLIYAQAVAALGVGEPRYLSHLFEPLRVDIPVDTRGVDPAAVQVGVSVSGVDPDTATRLGRQLQREWRVDEGGGYVLRITTDQAIDEPLMQLRVEVGDQQVQAVRELTLLFDPAPVEAPTVTQLAEAPASLPLPASAPVAAKAVAPVAVVEPVLIRKVAPIRLPATTVPAVVALSSAVVAKPLAAAPVTLTVSNRLGSGGLKAQIASTHRAQALSSVDRWQRMQVVEGDSIDSLAERVRGNETTLPLPLVTMLLRWLNPRAFDGVGSVPLVGAELRFPKPESLAAQMAVSGGVWTVEDITTTTADAAGTAVPPPSFQLLTPSSADALAQAMHIDPVPALVPALAPALTITAGSALFPARSAAAPSGLPPALTAGRAAGSAFAASGGLVGGALLAAVLSMVLMLKMVVTTPVPQASRYVPAAVVARSVSTSVAAPSAASARVLPAESLDLAVLDLGQVRQTETVPRRTES